ncbi:MAG: hypothetical protein QOH96_2440, partial [Blastocatellia bacterium]|nr:hypothetical protein [Blastocatellia bacterium]
KDFRRSIKVDHSELQSTFTGNSAFEEAGQLATPALSPLLRNDLSAAKSLMSTTGRIALESFLIAGSNLQFSQVRSPQISIILVLFNRAELTLQCLYSILKCNFNSYEVVIVDNGSSDETGSLLNQIEGARIIRNDTNCHYLIACNQASREAKGECLLLLNNDAQLLGNSLEFALKTLRSSDDIGAVGGRIVLPDGTLQEAGSIIWQDGSCLGYGRGESPLAPAYMFKRDVDYCSAAFLLTWRNLFLEGGGFDVAYVPAYYEETDYCVRLWKKNKRVVYDPDVAVLHFEFASSGPGKDAIELQTKNRKIFVTRHREWLEAQHVSSPEHSLTARSHRRHGAKKILFLDDRIPHLALGSGFPRSNRIISEVVKMGHIVTCYPVEYSQEHWQDVYQDIPREVEVMINHGLPGLERFLLERSDYFDIIFISRPHNMRIFKGLIVRRTDLCARAEIIYDAEAIFTLREIERRRINGKGPSVKDQVKLIEEEMRLAEPAGRIVSVSETESQEFRRFGFKDVHTLGHGLRVSPTAGGFAQRSGFLFVGAVHTATSPNADSLLWFTNHILPLIQKKLGNDLPVIVAGTVHPDIRDHLTRKGIDVKGTVSDLTLLYNNARVFIAPTRFAAGIPHKIHEAAAHGLPVVATSLLASQLGWVNGEDLLVAEDAESFADACIRLHHDSDLWNRLRDSALNKVSIDCSPDLFSQQLQAILA